MIGDDRPIPEQLRAAGKRLSWEQIDAVAHRLLPFADALNGLLLNAPHPGWADFSALLVMEKYGRALRLGVQAERISRETVANDVVAMLTWWHVITWKQIEARRAARAAAIEQQAAA